MSRAIISAVFFILLFIPGALQARTFSVDSNADTDVSGGETSRILAGLLEQMSLDLPDEDKVPDDEPPVEPDGDEDEAEPEPEPDRGGNGDDDFFDDDDECFSSNQNVSGDLSKEYRIGSGKSQPL